MVDVEELERDDGDKVDPRVRNLLEDVPAAARQVWEALSQRVQDEYDTIALEERDGAVGARWQGSLNKVLRELWPFAASSSAHMVGGAVTLRRELHHYLKESGNVLAAGPSQGQLGGDWWIRAAWVSTSVPPRSNHVTAEMVRAAPEEDKARRRHRIIDRLLPYVQANSKERYGVTELARAARVGSVTIYGLFDTVDNLIAAVDDALPKLTCRYPECGRRFHKPLNLGRHEQWCEHRPAVGAGAEIEVKREETEESPIMVNVNRALRAQVNELKRKYAALIAFASLEGTPIPRAAMNDVAVVGFSIEVRRAALDELLKSGVIRLERVGGTVVGEGRGFDAYVATDPRAALRGSSVDGADMTPATGDKADYHAVLNGLLAELDELRERDRKTATLREALKNL